ncbi:hypothetical protein QIU18_01270 [Capnocytophaga canimorsus]|nr:hypothetical protein [Capnocytophaga canimorsus]WGU70776.1 hypothetical protein QIU18_01270 [Capnocytophaga canimorsus]
MRIGGLVSIVGRIVILFLGWCYDRRRTLGSSFGHFLSNVTNHRAECAVFHIDETNVAFYYPNFVELLVIFRLQRQPNIVVADKNQRYSVLQNREAYHHYPLW